MTELPLTKDVERALSHLGDEHDPPEGWESRVLAAAAVVAPDTSRARPPRGLDYLVVGAGLTGVGVWISFLPMPPAIVLGLAATAIAPWAVHAVASRRRS
jgi:hypothetical protein